jgi:HEPN domain-containing protein
MDEAKRKLVQKWLIKTQHDLASARKLAADPDAYLDTASYFCQQAAEKAIKAFLVFHDQRFEKIHDIRKIILQAIPVEDRFYVWIEKASFLTSYVSAFRYPFENEEPTEPSRVEFERALNIAEQLYAFVLSLLPKEVHP